MFVVVLSQWPTLIKRMSIFNELEKVKEMVRLMEATDEPYRRESTRQRIAEGKQSLLRLEELIEELDPTGIRD